MVVVLLLAAREASQNWIRGNVVAEVGEEHPVVGGGAFYVKLPGSLGRGGHGNGGASSRQ